MLTILSLIACTVVAIQGTQDYRNSGVQLFVAGCQRNKMIPHPNSCTKYFYCKGVGFGVEKECSVGENFDPDFETCVWNQIYKCQEKNICEGKKDGVYSNPEKCDSFIKCVGGMTFNQACPTGLWYNNLKKSCDFPQNVKCKVKKITTLSPIKIHEENAIARDYCKDKKNGNYRDPRTCHHFITCSNGQIFEAKCPAGLLFEPKLQICDWPKNVKCNGIKSTIINPCVNKPNGMYPDNRFCEAYIVCYPEGVYYMKCPKSLWFNPETNKCDYPENVDCIANKRALQAANSSLKSSICNGRIGIFPEPGSCSAYLVCQSNGRETTKFCPPGLHYHPKYMICVHNSTYPCVNGSATENICEGKQNEALPNPTACDSYIACHGGLKYQIDCPKPLWFNKDNGQCDFPENVNCTVWNGGDSKDWTTSSSAPITPTLISSTEEEIPLKEMLPKDFCNGKAPGNYAHPTKCNAFVACTGVSYAILNCPDGLWFNETQNICDYPSDVRCLLVNTEADTRTLEAVITSTVASEALSKLSVTQTSQAQFTVYPFFCVGKPPGNYAHPIRCDLFITCTGISFVVLSCPSGLWFNETQNMCDYPNNVDCISWSTDSSKETTIEALPQITSQATSPVLKTTQISKVTSSEATLSLVFCAGKTPGNYAHPTRCDAFVTCTGAFLTVQSCPHGLWFNETQNICDYPSNVNCIPWSTETSTTSSAEVTTPSLPLNICYGKKSGNYAHPSSCGAFITCSGDLVLVQSCPHGLWFNELQNICDYPENVQCVQNIPNTQSINCYGKIAGAYATDKCNEYYTCTSDGIPLKKTCPLHTNFFPKTGTCVLSYSFSCEEPAFCATRSNGKYINQYNCYGYYDCINGRTIPRNCDYGWRFNGIACVDASLYVCPT